MVLRWGGRRATEPLGRDLVAWLSPDALGGSSNGDVAFGENTADEMCFSFVMYYPKRNFLVWAQPASVSTCGVTK